VVWEVVVAKVTEIIAKRGLSEAIRDGIIDFLVAQIGDPDEKGVARCIARLRSDALQDQQILQAFEVAVERWVNSYDDHDLVAAVAECTTFVDLPSVRKAIRAFARRPSDPIAAETLQSKFGDVLPQVEPARLERGVTALLELLQQELFALPPLQATQSAAAALRIDRSTRQILDTLTATPDLQALRTDYLDSLRCRQAYLDLGGIAPKVANRTVKLRVADIFVPLEAWGELDERWTWTQMLRLWTQPVGRKGSLSRPGDISLSAGLSVDWKRQYAFFQDRLAHEAVSFGWRAFATRLRSLFQGRLAQEAASIEDILAAPRAVLLGHPGTGKSTCLQYAAYAIAAGRGELVGQAVLSRLPIFVRLVYYARAQRADPTLCLRDYVRDLHDRDRAPLFRQCLKKGNCLVMLDGLDEVIDPQERAEIADQVEVFVADYPNNHYLVTSRIVGYQAGRLTGDFAHFKLGSLPESSIRNFVHKWYEAIEQESGAEASGEIRHLADELCHAIEERPGIRRLAENPLLLTIIALVNWKGRRLPNHRVEVYSYAVETLVESWPRRWRGVTFDTDEVIGLLEPVGYRIFADRSSEEIAESELRPLLVRAVVETRTGMGEAEAGEYVDDLLPRLSEHSGLFLERGSDAESGERLFGFLHLTFAEYLAARHLAGQWQAEKDDAARRAFLAGYARVPRWRDILLLMADHLGLYDSGNVRATHVLADLLCMETPHEDHLHQDLLLAGRCLTDDLRSAPQISGWVLDKLTQLLVETPIEPLQERIIALAQQMAGTVYEGALEGRLLAWQVDKNEGARSGVALVLGEIGSKQAEEGLLRLLADTSAEVRGSAAWALGRIGSERAEENLLRLLADTSAEVRGRVAGALGLLKSERAKEGLLELLADTSAEVRGWAALALRGMGSERGEEDLLRLLADTSASVRGSAAWALGEIGSKRAEEGLLRLLEDTSASVRVNAARALGRMRSKQTEEDLLRLLADTSARVRGSAAWALGRMRSERAEDGLLRLLADKSAEVRDCAIWALGETGGEQAEESLLELLADGSEEVRGKAAKSLGRIRSKRVEEGLIELLADESADVRGRAAQALGEIGSERAVENLLRLLADESADVRGRAAQALGEIGNERAVENLLKLLIDENKLVRDTAIWALGEMGSGEVVENLLCWLSKTDLLPATGQEACNWAYTTLIEILEHHAPDPGCLPSSPVQEPVLPPGPWSQGYQA